MAKQSRKARKQEKQKELNEMTQKQYQTILKLKKYAEGIGKKCEFEKIPCSNNIMKYEEEVVNEENVLVYFFMIGVREDGSVFITCCKDLNVKEDGKETAAKYIELLDEKSNDTTCSVVKRVDTFLNTIFRKDRITPGFPCRTPLFHLVYNHQAKSEGV